MRVVILGNGVTGVTAALRIRERQPDWEILLVSGESDYHYSRPALMYIFMGHMRYQDTKPFEDRYWDAHRIGRRRAWVNRIDTDRRELHTTEGNTIAYDRLLLATGSQPNRFDWPGQDLEGVQGLWGLPDLHRLYTNVERTRRAVIVGGGLIGVELAEMLHSRGVAVTFLARESSYWGNVLPPEESEMVGEIIRQHDIDLRLESTLAEILGDSSGRVRAVVTGEGETIECEFVGLTAGVRPNLSALEGSGIPTERGILVDRSLRTRVPDVFAAGDCAEIEVGEGERNLVQQVWYTGKMQGELVGDVIAGDDRTYSPGIWFNSAKFFDLEYQTYGDVHRKLDGEGNLYWQHDRDRVAIRLVHQRGALVGVNVMGTRWRHEVCEGWIRDRVPIGEVLDRLNEATFDPEFARRHARSAVATLRSQLS